jgi:hypothetical protein
MNHFLFNDDIFVYCIKRLRQDNENISHEREKERKQYMGEKEENENTLKRFVFNHIRKSFNIYHFKDASLFQYF